MNASIADALADGVMRGDKRAMARAITLIESGGTQVDMLLDTLFPHTGRAFRLGITGPPGAGKSTLVTRLTTHYREQGASVGVIAIDPTSPFSGGALLGDRIRMLEIGMDPGVFIRSMATRGALGGLSRAAKDAADVLDASGKDIVIVETVGVGQSELDIVGATDATVVVLVPESGDAIQAMKAGLMEIADIFVVNKSDRAGAEQAVDAIGRILSFRVTHDPEQWIPPVLKTIASEGSGITELAAAIETYRAHQSRTNGSTTKRERQVQARIREIVEAYRHDLFWNQEKRTELNAGIPAVLARLTSPYSLAQKLMSQ